MDRITYIQKLEHILANRVRGYRIIYQYFKVSKQWKIVSKRCNLCNRGFNKDMEGKFATHKCKKNYKETYV